MLIHRQTRTGSVGFTLIEMMVVISIIALISGIGVARYNRFNRRQQVKESGKDFVSVLRNTQNRAITGDKPASGCMELEGFQVSPTLGGNQYTVDTVCDPEGSVEKEPKSLRSGLVSFIDPSNSVTFAPLYGTAESDTTITIGHSVAGVEKLTIIVTAGGNISCSGCD